MGLADYAADWWQWWVWQVRGLRGTAPDASVAGAVVSLGRDGVQVGRTAPDASEWVGDPAAVGEAVLSLAPEARQRGIDLLIGPGRFLRRPLSPLRLPRSRARAMAGLDLVGGTPFRADECNVLLPDYRESQPESSYLIVRRAQVEPVLASLAAVGVDVHRVRFADPSGTIEPDAAGRRALLGAGPEGFPGQATRWAAAAAVAGLLLLFGVAHWRYETALADVDGRIATAEAKAGDARRRVEAQEQMIAQVAAARGAKSEAVPLIRILEEMARRIPDDTWLTDMDFRNETITFSGISTEAPELIPALDASPLFRGPTFSQPVVRAPEQGGDRFTVTMSLEGTHG